MDAFWGTESAALSKHGHLLLERTNFDSHRQKPADLTSMGSSWAHQWDLGPQLQHSVWSWYASSLLARKEIDTEKGGVCWCGCGCGREDSGGGCYSCCY